jgi:hypothetical protein
MGGLLSELGKKLAERWLTLLVLPGALYLAVVASAYNLGHSHALDIHRLTSQITTWAKDPAVTTIGGQVLLLAAVLAGAAGAGLAAQSLGSLMEQLIFAANWRTWPPPLRRLADWRVTSRKTRWDTAHAAYHEHREAAGKALALGHRLGSEKRHAAHRAVTRISPEPPDRPTWSGDRIHAVSIRIERDLHLNLVTVWPHLWLTLPDTTRTEITNARQALTRATTFAGWALLYCLLIIYWWPAVLITFVLLFTVWQRTRIATDTYAQLLEAATRLNAGDLARKLGIDHTGPLNTQTGESLTDLLHTQPPPPVTSGDS